MRDRSLSTTRVCVCLPRPRRFRRAHRCQSGDGWHPLLEQELGQGGGLRDLPSPEPGPYHARLLDLPAGLVRAPGVTGSWACAAGQDFWERRVEG